MVDKPDGGGEAERTCCNWLACSESGGSGEEGGGREGAEDLDHAYATAAATLSYFMI